MKEEYVVHPGSSIPIFIDETPEEHAFHLRPPQSSDSLNDKSFNGVQHLISIKVDGTSRPSIPISMDVVGLNYFEVNFSKASEKKETPKNEDSWNIEDRNGQYSTGGFVVPVVLDVSVQQYSKLIRLYSTVLDPIYPGQEFPLPLHLAEAGLMRWRPLDKNYLWSEAQQLSNLLSMENKSGFLRSFVCYPSHPSSDPFRCCISVQHINLPSSTLLKEGHSILPRASTALFEDQDQRGYILGNAKKRFIHYVTLTTPLFVRSYIPHKVSVTIESGGISRTVVLSEAGSSSVFHVDSTHDLGLLFHVHGFSPCTSKFQRAETFATVSKLNETKFSSSESLVIRPDSCTGPIYVVLEKVVDALCGARELCISVPFLLYNCTGLPLAIAGFGNEIEGNSFSIPSCYHLDEVDKLLSKKHGLALVNSEQDSHKHCSTSKNNPLALRESSRLCGQMSLSTGFTTRDSVAHSLEQKISTSQLQASECDKEFDVMDSVTRTAKACIYSPHPSSSASELMVRLSLRLPESNTGDATNSVWSSSFFLVPPSGSTSVVVPQTSTSGAFIISATSSQLSPFSGRTRAITFQPRELLISLRFNEPGWMWSGSFSPDHLGDTQVKMRNYVSGAVYMIRVEIQNADVPIKDEKIVGSTIGKSGTLLILLSDDNTGFMPYRIDNFSMERLRVYQQKCEVLETVVHSYTSCPYAWDEPCFPHRLVVEVPGECVLGSYALDVVKEQTSVYLPSTSEKPGRRLFLAIHAEGAIKLKVGMGPHSFLRIHMLLECSWMLKNEGLISAEYLGNASGTVLQRGLLVLADVEEAPVLLRELIVDHHMGSWESFQEILIRHYTRQLLHETYKIFGSAGVIGNPMGFARNLGLGIKDFLSVPARGIFRCFEEVHGKFTEISQIGLTGFLQSPVRGAEKHGLPGVLSGIALGTAGLVARPVASILEVTGKTAQSIRNRSRLHRPRHFRVRFPRPLVRGLPTQPYSWEEAIGATMLLGAADAKLKDEIYVKCKALKQTGTFVIITKRLIIIFSCSSLVELKTSEFHIVADPEWVIQVEMGLETVIHVDREKEVLNIVGSRSETLLKQPQQKKTIARTKWSTNTSPLFQMNLEFKNEEEAEEVLQVILSTFEHIKEHHFGVHVLHQSNLRQKSTP
ncbi:hypothetical protein Scep_019125 [Stephania cephalantha]|uniref:Vacuolar protein sorting-associated protein 13 DH-like domain-containing protein n=1 Tax=Stephania cephalantha TaxID=152367 RepID=A0AAP0IA43_9MAGN